MIACFLGSPRRPSPDLFLKRMDAYFTTSEDAGKPRSGEAVLNLVADDTVLLDEPFGDSGKRPRQQRIEIPNCGSPLLRFTNLDKRWRAGSTLIVTL
jgi:hypothetical protein